jgi:spore coat polysaccharide biosynthesis protein SpsF (cytidylyltransferase family)
LKVVAIVQARMSSERFPGKVLAEIQGKPSLELLLKRLSNAKRVDQIVVVTSKEKSESKIRLLLKTKCQYQY